MYANAGCYSSAPASVDGSTEAPSPPGAPTITAYSASYDASSGGPVENVTVEVPYDGGSQITSFTADWSGDGTSASTTAEDPCPSCPTFSFAVPLPASLPASVSGGTTVYPYRLTVTATNRAGVGPPSDPVSFANTLPAQPPAAITTAAGPLRIVGAPGVAVGWQPPAFDGGEPITTYIVQLQGPGLSPGGVGYDCFQQVNDCNEPGGLTAAALALPAAAYGRTYTLQMFSVNGVGTRLIPSAPLSFTPIAPPGAPHALTASYDAAARTIKLSWAAPSFDGGSPVSSYTIGYVGPDARSVSSVGSSARSATLRLSPYLPQTAYGVTFHVFVLADNAAGLGPAAKTTVAVVVRCPPRRCSPPRHP